MSEEEDFYECPFDQDDEDTGPPQLVVSEPSLLVRQRELSFNYYEPSSLPEMEPPLDSKVLQTWQAAYTADSQIPHEMKQHCKKHRISKEQAIAMLQDTPHGADLHQLTEPSSTDPAPPESPPSSGHFETARMMPPEETCADSCATEFVRGIIEMEQRIGKPGMYISQLGEYIEALRRADAGQQMSPAVQEQAMCVLGELTNQVAACGGLASPEARSPEAARGGSGWGGDAMWGAVSSLQSGLGVAAQQALEVAAYTLEVATADEAEEEFFDMDPLSGEVRKSSQKLVAGGRERPHTKKDMAAVVSGLRPGLNTAVGMVQDTLVGAPSEQQEEPIGHIASDELVNEMYQQLELADGAGSASLL